MHWYSRVSDSILLKIADFCKTLQSLREALQHADQTRFGDSGRANDRVTSCCPSAEVTNDAALCEVNKTPLASALSVSSGSVSSVFLNAQ